MKIHHRIPLAAFRRETATPEYQHEVARSTASAEMAYQQAQRRLAAAEKRRRKADDAVLAAASIGHSTARLAREAAILAELEELRREELLQIEALMKSYPASTTHRGRGSYRPIPQPGPVI